MPGILVGIKNTRAGIQVSTTSPRTFPLKVSLALTAAVLLAHLGVLQGTRMTLDLNQAQPGRAFSTRTIALDPVARTPAPRPVTPAAAAPRKKTHPAPAREERPIASAVPAGNGDGAPQSPTLRGATENPGTSETAATPIVANAGQELSGPEQPGPPPRPPREPVSPVVAAYVIPESVRVKYKVEANKFPYSLNAELLWQRSGPSYEARLELSTFGQTRSQTSRGHITPEGLAPMRFADKYRSEVAAHFEREKGKVTFSANTPDVALLAGAQDRLSILVQLAAMIAGDPSHYPPATTIAIQTIGPRAADTWLFTVGDKETLTLPGGEQATLKLVRNPRQEYDQKVELWLAPALGYLPARIRITEPNGDFIDQKWLAAEPRN